jgi:hypothetical protein
MPQPDLFARQIKDDLEGFPTGLATPVIWFCYPRCPVTLRPPGFYEQAISFQ